MKRFSTKDLYAQLQERIILHLEENEVPCLECKGLRFNYVADNEKEAHIETCRGCYTGKLTVCKYCGKACKSWCDCRESQDARHNQWRAEQKQKELALYEKAEKISWKDYDGYFLFDGCEYLKTADDLEDWIYDRIMEEEDVPDFLWSTKGTQYINIDLNDVIYNACEDGYEDMYDYLSTKSPLIAQAQELINQWQKEQGDNLNIYNANYKQAIIIKDLVDKIRGEMHTNNENN